MYDPFLAAARTGVYNGFHEGYGKFGIKTVWLDAAEPERPQMDTVGKFLFSAGTDSEVGSAWIHQHVSNFYTGVLIMISIKTRKVIDIYLPK